ncbi:S-layer homology domain-containing protein [Oscillibacter sp.]|uniref:S-layer homology domain-containing protein n=1 Tax=Oscillibacter sp. TaxID=1945593 RepID=UPI0028B1234D|nr:S-layer homology domain-containing protein [Oscillibacter sp.]
MIKYLKRLVAAGLSCLCLLTVLPVSAAAAPRFSDVPKTHWAAESIARAAEKGLLNGRSDGTFGMGKSMTRAAFAAVLCRLFEWEKVSPATGSFTDNRDTAKWYYGAVETVFVRGAVTQQEEKFRPGDAITRAEMAVMLVRSLGYGTLAGLAGERKSSFTDVTFSLGYLLLASDLGIMTGNTRGEFQPDKPVTREQAAAVLMRVYDKLHAPAPELIGIARSAEKLSLTGVGTVAVPALKLVYNGSLQLVPDVGEETVAAIQSAAGDRRMLLQVSGSGPVFAEVNPAALAKDLAAAAADGGWDGVLLDISKLTGTDRAALTTLAAALRTALGKDKLFFVMAEAPVQPGSTAYNGYDFAGLAAVADKIILRIAPYYQVISGLPTTPKEPLEEVYYAMEAVASAIPAEKIMLLLTVSGSKWRGERAEGDVSAAELSVLRSTSGVTGYWSGRYAAPYLSYTNSGQRVVVWYNDARSAQARRQLSSFFGGGGLCLNQLTGPLDGEDGILSGLQ